MTEAVPCVHRVTFCAGEQRWRVGLVPLLSVSKHHGTWYTVHRLDDEGKLAAVPALTVAHDHFGVLTVPEGYPFRQEITNEVDCWVLDFPEKGDIRRWGRAMEAGEYLTAREVARRCRAFLGRRIAAAKVATLATDGDLWDLKGGRPGEPLRIWEAELPKVIAALR
jgi:hypothetical protein